MAKAPLKKKKKSARDTLRTAVGMGVLGAALLLGLLLLILALMPGSNADPGDDPERPDAGSRGAKASRGSGSPGYVSNSLTDTNGKPLLGNQSEQKRNQILVVDLFREVLNRYPNMREQHLWFDVSSPANQSMQQMRRRGASDGEIANYIAGLLMDSDELRGRMPEIKVAGSQLHRGSLDLSDGSAIVGAMLSRAVGYRDDLKRSEDLILVESLAKEFGLERPSDRSLYPVTRMMHAISGSSDVNEHFLDDDVDLQVEVEAMKVALRRGKLLVLYGSDAPKSYRYIAVAAFDGRGQFVIRDPIGRLPDHLSPVALAGFLVKPGQGRTPASDERSFWLDMPGEHRVAPCPGSPGAMVAASNTQPAVVAQVNEGAEFTSVINGAQVNLERARIPPGEHTLRGSMSMTAENIDEVLSRAGSPAVGSGAAFVKWGRFYNVDPVYALAFFRRESTLGAHKRWIGRMPNGETTRNIGNIRFRGAPNAQREPQYTGYNGFRAYASWEDGIHDWYKLIASDANYAGLHTVEQILPKYAPSFENDTDNYTHDVVLWVKEWRDRYASGAPTATSASTVAQELEKPNAQLTRYGDCPP